MVKKNKMMNYKEMLTKWWFWTPIGISFLFSIKSNIESYGSIFAPEFLGILLGTILGWGILFSIGWLIYFGIKKMSKKSRN